MEEELEEQEEDICIKVFILSHPLNNIEIVNYFNYEPRFNGASSRNNVPIIKDVAYVINLDDKNSKGTRWIYRNTVVYIHSFEIEYIPPEVLNQG